MNLYESNTMHDLLGDVLRPGGFEITKRALEYCKFESGDCLLDAGCGMGATINYINNNYDFKIIGLDKSEKLASLARELNKNTEIIVSSAESTIFEDKMFDGVLAECTLSLMDVNKALMEINRVLKNNGYLIITDLYVNNTEFLDDLKRYPVNTCLKSPFDLQALKKHLVDSGFKIILAEKYDDVLIQLMADIIFRGGSMDKLLCAGDCFDSNMKNLLIKSKPGYFLIIAQKEEFNAG